MHEGKSTKACTSLPLPIVSNWRRILKHVYQKLGRILLTSEIQSPLSQKLQPKLALK